MTIQITDVKGQTSQLSHVKNDVEEPDPDEVASNSSASLTDASENFDFLTAMLPILKEEAEPQDKGPATLNMIKKASAINVDNKPAALTKNVNADL